jgi:signal transduction histidine kinase
MEEWSRMLSGKFEIGSKEGKGTQITIEIPAVEAKGGHL